MKVKCVKGDIIITPKPKKDIPNGLCVLGVEKGLEYLSASAAKTLYTDIYKSQSLYVAPFNTTILKVWINENK